MAKALGVESTVVKYLDDMSKLCACMYDLNKSHLKKNWVNTLDKKTNDTEKDSHPPAKQLN